MKPKIIKLAYGERIIAVVPEKCSSPGWGHTPTWVFIATNDGRLREECIQPSEQTMELNSLFYTGEVVCHALIESIPVIKAKSPATRRE